ncbi:MAG TPA: acyl-CoA reductase [Chitinophagaceae bacterium]|nr:acyl-CoA reductase [Chitinophagaceae bacterium]
MILSQRIDLLSRLGAYMLSDNEEWEEARAKASRENPWFIPEFVKLAGDNIARAFLQNDLLQNWVSAYQLLPTNPHPKKVGIIMAGNIPLVGFHDLLCVFISGHKAIIKPSSKDDALIRHLVEKIREWEPETAELIQFAERLKNCDAYIATGSNNSAGYFEYYFKKYPHIIRRNRTSVAILTGKETRDELEKLADDVYLYFGLGCRNVSKIFVPTGYDFIPLLRAFDKYNNLADHSKYMNNYDYNLAIQILNKKFYMSNPSLLLVEDVSPFSPISRLNYEFYDDLRQLNERLKKDSDIQCIAGNDHIGFGQSQYPGLADYADGVDTLKFLTNL